MDWKSRSQTDRSAGVIAHGQKSRTLSTVVPRGSYRRLPGREHNKTRRLPCQAMAEGNRTDFAAAISRHTAYTKEQALDVEAKARVARHVAAIY